MQRRGRIGVYPGTGRTRDWPERWLGWVPKRPSTSALALELTSTYDPPDASGAGVCPLPPVTRSAIEATSSAKAWVFTGAPPEPRDMVPRYVRTRVRCDEWPRRASYAASSATFERPLLFLVHQKGLDLTHNNRQTHEFIVQYAISISLFLFSSRLLKHTEDLFVRESSGARRSFMTNFDDDCRHHHSSQRAPVQGTQRLANPKVRERHSPLHASRGLGTPEAPPQGEEPSPRAITMSAVGSLAAVPTVSGHSLRALKRASSKASKSVVRSGA